MAIGTATHRPRHIAARLVLLAALVAGSQQAASVVFSVAAGSPATSGGITAADLLAPGPLGGPPVVAFTAASLGLAPGDDLDALSFGSFQGGEPHFSVDSASGGAAGSALAAEAAAGQQAGDIYKDPFPVNLPGSNTLVTNQDALGLAPAVPAGTVTALAQDELDALDMDTAALADPDGDGTPNLPVYFSLAPGSPSLAAFGAGPADILVTNPGGAPLIAVSAVTMGLLPGDDVDALLYDPNPGGTLLISLSAGSPTLLALGITGADVFAPLIAPPGFLGPSLLNQTISTLGLATSDELDAFSDLPTGGAAVAAAPGALGLSLTWMLAVAVRARRRRRFR